MGSLIQKLRKHFHQPWFGGGVGAILTVLFGLFLLFFPVGKGLRDWSYDIPFLIRPEKKIDNVVIVYLDEPTYSQLNQKPASFDRHLYAELLKRLQADGAKLAVFDIFFDPKAPTDSDAEFAQSIKMYGKVILGAQYHEDEHILKNIEIYYPIDLLRDAAAASGLVMIHEDTDFEPRRHHPGKGTVPSMAWRAAALMGAPITKNPANWDAERWLNYYSHDLFQGISFYEALPGKSLPPGFSFKDKAVFIGAGKVAGYTGDKREEFRNPWTWISTHFHQGVEIHALTFANLMRQDWLRRMPTLAEFFVLVLTGCLLGYGLSLFRPLQATGIAILFSIVIVAVALLLSAKFNVWFSWLIVIAAQTPLALGWSYMFHSIRAYMETKLLATSLELYLSPHQVKQILKQPELLKPGATQKTVSILFSDIANFSKISERMDPDDLVTLLNSYYETSIACVHETEGTVMNLIGDAILAIWNAPQDQADHQQRACKAAVRLQESLVHFDSAHRSLPMRTRVGLHTGLVCVGNIGSSTHFDYAAIGESVNMASRLEGLNKQLGTNILATREIQKTSEGQLVTRLVGHFRFKGFDQVTEIYELIGSSVSEKETQPWRDAFANALSRFQRQAFAEAETGFRQTLEIRPDDGPSKFYLDRAAQLRAHPPEQGWLGEIDLREK
jgi:adenylate cyclase